MNSWCTALCHYTRILPSQATSHSTNCSGDNGTSLPVVTATWPRKGTENNARAAGLTSEPREQSFSQNRSTASRSGSPEKRGLTTVAAPTTEIFLQCEGELAYCSSRLERRQRTAFGYSMHLRSQMKCDIKSDDSSTLPAFHCLSSGHGPA